MGDLIDFNEYKAKKNVCPVCGDGQTQPCSAECFGIPTDEIDN